MDLWTLVLFCLLPIAAFLYASVGHGGASSYLMILTLMGFLPEDIRPSALLLNIFVSLISFLNFRKQESLQRDLFFSLIVFSIPAAYLGGTILLDTDIYRKILGVILLFPALRFLMVFPESKKVVVERKIWMAPLLGVLIGLLSGLVGIGGGVLLTPIVLVLGWANVKQTAVLSSLFIFLNSIAGFVGSGALNFDLPSEFWVLIPITIAGGLLGGYFGARKFSNSALRYLLCAVLIFASVKLLLN
ncbi:sulfite exporter TauE/SafE family protein [Belliella sp. DSM 107340]|uniref:Probable membrane transporter protein n=1 Tax=Belliella calami TaxID=2923436 RepID=A0ABS9UQS8_9BACT|nr:sulfite exporter TauE/SafE family protein [Belliella calami]MCH7398790.1 sulfite exporter TauE/SafE family protein [Belliella calami]